MHPHADVEGITYVWKGVFRHADSLGHNGLLQPGAIQLMTLGSGALHSEQNGSATEPMEFLQLWILPATPSLSPAVQQHQFTREDRADRLLKVIGPDKGDPVKVHQDAAVYVAALERGREVRHSFDGDRAGYLYLIEGSSEVNGNALSTGDAVKIASESRLTITANAESELILVDVPAHFRPVGVWARG
jgi:redox-sensitive bicupin YhaK (pirin superfamily)